MFVAIRGLVAVASQRRAGSWGLTTKSLGDFWSNQRFSSRSVTSACWWLGVDSRDLGMFGAIRGLVAGAFLEGAGARWWMGVDGSILVMFVTTRDPVAGASLLEGVGGWRLAPGRSGRGGLLLRKTLL